MSLMPTRQTGSCGGLFLATIVIIHDSKTFYKSWAHRGFRVEMSQTLNCFTVMKGGSHSRWWTCFSRGFFVIFSWFKYLSMLCADLLYIYISMFLSCEKQFFGHKRTDLHLSNAHLWILCTQPWWRCNYLNVLSFQELIKYFNIHAP